MILMNIYNIFFFFFFCEVIRKHPYIMQCIPSEFENEGPRDSLMWIEGVL